MQKAIDSDEFHIGKMISVNPDRLRAIAQKMEEHSKRLSPNEAYRAKLTDDIWLYYEPLKGGQAPSVSAQFVSEDSSE